MRGEAAQEWGTRQRDEMAAAWEMCSTWNTLADLRDRSLFLGRLSRSLGRNCARMPQVRPLAVSEGVGMLESLLGAGARSECARETAHDGYGR
jgi:hypothetical protein